MLSEAAYAPAEYDSTYGHEQETYRVDLLQVERFLQSWFRYLQDGEYIEIRAFAPPMQMFFADIDDCLEWLAIFEFAQGLYYGVHPRLRERGRAEDVSRINGLYADLDPYKGSPAAAGSDRDAMLQRVVHVVGGNNNLIAVDSGNGLHVLVAFDQPYALSATTREQYARAQRGFSYCLGGDPKAVDIARVLRLPGTMNTKGRPWKPCTLMSVR